ncbi:MAG: hypothetical protein KDB90_18130 [Planctomycetes bacterium]|nr:hypothetical protein [Planctomycetota bacterium]
MPQLWLQDPQKLPRPAAGADKAPALRKTPLFDLLALQAELQAGRLGIDDVRIETVKCGKDLQKLKWTTRDLLDFILCLRPYKLNQQHDFEHARWCKDSGGRWYPCDAYAALYDTTNKCRAHGGVSVYVKFSIPENGDSLLIMISAHD